VDPARKSHLAWLPLALRRLERKLGADREGRTLWVWTVPAATVIVTFFVLAFVGVQGKVDLALTVPMALVLSLFLGSLSAFYLTAASADERDQEEDGPDDHHRPTDIRPPGPPPDGVTQVVLRVPGRPSPSRTASRSPRARPAPHRKTDRPRERTGV
jgi:hypothetical protein